MHTLICQCVQAKIVSSAASAAVLTGITGLPGRWTVVQDLCGAATRREAWLRDWASGAAAGLSVVACHPRAVRWLLEWAGMANAGDLRFLNLRDDAPETVLTALRATADTGPSLRTDQVEPPGWTPWFPVIDRDRCVNCHQCRNFCPFGVYETGAGNRVEVRNPTHCKTNCPACARLCPEVAIVFPKHGPAPINGAPVTAADLDQRRASVLEKRLKKEDIHAILARRSACAAAKDCPKKDACPSS
jgi:Pyruvate/2-oxoacid:ferredoxin oxidoreductase delta subunit